MGVLLEIQEAAQLCENWKMLAGKSVKVHVGKRFISGKIPLDWWKARKPSGVGQSGFDSYETLPLVVGGIEAELQVKDIGRVDW